MNAPEQARPVLDPIDRLSEIIFGLLMALSFTGTMSVAVAGGDEVRSVLMAALGCNVAWGIVDGVMFVLTTAVERVKRFNFIEFHPHRAADGGAAGLPLQSAGGCPPGNVRS